ncbi:MAG TPA: PhzF family phenazine biosynthesis protein [Chitinophagaceae bacterium]|nr:PhzF family phenazine biosynthesis protein [Chitinophagaceae bacterium]
MHLTLYQVDAFTNRLFGGNPAAVIPLPQWIPDDLMQQLAMENNLAETVFFVPQGPDYAIRWFTPVLEINLCGHATLASAFILYNYLGYDRPRLTFHSKSGPLVVERQGNRFLLDFPSWKPERISDYPDDLAAILGVPEILGVYRYRDLLVEVADERAVRAAQPDFGAIKKRGDKVILTAPGREVDFVSRFFAPSAGIDEDPVTGSAHSQLIPFWSEKLGKPVMQARQLSRRGGEIYCEQRGQRVTMGGECVYYMKGEILL